MTRTTVLTSPLGSLRLTKMEPFEKRPRKKKRPIDKSFSNFATGQNSAWFLCADVVDSRVNPRDRSDLFKNNRSNTFGTGFLWMIGMFIGVVFLVTLFVWKKPECLLFEKEQYLPPEL